MTNEEMQQHVESIFQILAQTTRRLDDLTIKVADLTFSLKQVEQNQRADALRITRLEENMTTLTKTVSTLVEVVRNQDERMDYFDARVDKLVVTIERYITARGANGHEGGDERA